MTLQFTRQLNGADLDFFISNFFTIIGILKFYQNWRV